MACSKCQFSLGITVIIVSRHHPQPAFLRLLKIFFLKFHSTISQACQSQKKSKNFFHS